MIPEHIFKLIEKKTYPEQKGGQQVCIVPHGVTITCDEYMFSMSCALWKSQIKKYGILSNCF